MTTMNAKKPATITSRVASALWRGFVGTPAEIAIELGLTRAQVSRALCSLLKSNPWIHRVKVGRTYRYEGRVAATPAKAAQPRKTSTRPKSRKRQPQGARTARRAARADVERFTMMDLPEQGLGWAL